MKNCRLILMAFAAISFFACSSNSDSPDQGNLPTGESATLSIHLAGSGQAKSKAQGTPTPAEESNVNDGIIYVFDASGHILTKAFFSAGDITGNTGSKEIETTTAASSVAVLLNTGISDAASITGTPYDIPTKSKLETIAVDLAEWQGKDATTQVKNNLLMSGVSTDPINFTGDPKMADVTVKVSRIVAKVVMDWSFEPTSALTDKIRLVGAVILNVPLSSYLFGTTLTPADTKYLEGLPADTLDAFPYEGYRPVDGNMISNVGLLAIDNFQVTPVPENHFYIFANTPDYPTIVALVADFNENGIDQPTPAANVRKYYPVVINKARTGGQDGSMTVQRNVTYNVKITVKGIGVDNPFNPGDPASLNVIVTVEDWALTVNVEQTFE